VEFCGKSSRYGSAWKNELAAAILINITGGIMALDIEISREIVVEADAETLGKMRKEGHARGFTVYCDEAERTGGENSAPPPLAYFALSLGF
jgi:hypothetical protein